MESTTTEKTPVTEGLPKEALETQEKSTEAETCSSLAKVDACRVSRRSIPGKIWMPTNQITDKSYLAHVSRELRARALQVSRGI